MAAPAASTHSNCYVRGFPSTYSEADLIQLFSEHGSIVSLRVVAATEGQAPHAFVKFELPSQAAGAIQALNGSAINGIGGQLVVKFADADVQPRVESGRQPSEWCYCRNLPASCTRQDVGEMFVAFGTVLEIRLFPSTELYKGSGALVQMQSMEQASAAIQMLNGSFPRGATQPLLVRYADSPAEKAAKQQRKERLVHKQPVNTGMFGGNNLLAAQLQQQLLGLAINGNGGSMSLPNGSSLGSPDLSSDLPSMLAPLDYSDSSGSGGLPSAAVLQQQAAAMTAPGGGASIYIKGMPEDADKLWLYEKFARFGGICSVRVLIDEQSGKCNGVGFVNYVTADAARLAQESMNGVSMGDRLLHVMVQNPAARGRGSLALGPGSGLPVVPGPGSGAGLPMTPGGPPGGGLGPSSAANRQSQQQAAVMQAAANQLGISASALASLQAGLLPAATNGMSLQPMQGLQDAQQGYGGGALGHTGGSFGSLHW